MIKIVNGNILNASEDIICHQVNCQGVMGSGLAKQIRSKYPEVFDQYKEYCKYIQYPKQLLGKALPVKCWDGKIVFNLFGQLYYGKDGKQYTDYDALRECFKNIKRSVLFETGDLYHKTIAIPFQIGCGLAGGSWNIVYNIIEDVFIDYDVTIYKLV